MMETIKVNGIRSSDQFLQVSQHFDGRSDPLRLHQLLAADRINISFLYLDYSAPEHVIACCIPPEKLHHARTYPNAGVSSWFDCVPDTGLISVYPHGFSLDLIGFFIQLQAQQPFGFRYMASSNAMLSFVLGYGDQDRVAEMLSQKLDLPPYRAPDRLPQGYDHIAAALKKDPETVATYVESRIKTYGIQVRGNLVLCRLAMASDDLAGWGDDIRKMAGQSLRFAYAAAVRDPDSRIQLDLVLEGDFDADIFSPERADCIRVREGAGMIHLQGPHFGDRFGIADAAMSCLHRNGIPILLAGCVGASISIILPAEALRLAESVLMEVFQAP